MRCRLSLKNIAIIGLLPVALSGCSVYRDFMGIEEVPPPIVETHLAPCAQPHRGSPMRNCTGNRTIYTPRPASERQVY